MVIAEAIQSVLRKEGFDQPYEALKELTRGNKDINKKTFEIFIDNLNVSDDVKLKLKSITPSNYSGIIDLE